QETLFELLRREVGDNGPHHGGVERERLGNARELHLFMPDMALKLRPVLSAPLDGPSWNREARGIQNLLALNPLVFREFFSGDHFGPDTFGNLRREELAHLLPERLIFWGQLQSHWAPLHSAVPRRL